MPYYPTLEGDADLISDHRLGMDAFVRGEPRFAPSDESQDAYTEFDDWQNGWSIMWTRCYGQGVKAALSPTKVACPYPEHSPGWEAWVAGSAEAEHL